ncbi:MAG: hypothetical protein CM1200mP30_14090 [Pseudomonadota bacterium]|nr:MAG: hypothetical protein CM1200mP30_14090 [Pseudomonadota bacterium]
MTDLNILMNSFLFPILERVFMSPAPPNQVIHVILDKPVHFEVISFAIWITGILEIGITSLKDQMILASDLRY